MSAHLEEGLDVISPVGALQCVVVTPEMTVLEASAAFIVVPMFDGELGIAPLRGSMIGRLGFGELRLEAGEDSHRLYIDGGFVQISDNMVTILTSRAFPVEEIDPEAAAEQLASARQRQANSDETFRIRERLQAQSRAQLRLSQKKKS